MQVFFVVVDEFLKKHSKDFLSLYADIEIKTQKRFYEYTIGRYLVKYIAQKYYNLDNTEIVVNKEGKPFFKNADLSFSISHSKNIVIACFDKYTCAIDAEYMKVRDIQKLSKYFEKSFKTLEDFYKFWTQKEALYKLGNKACDTCFCFDIKNYCICVSSIVNVEKNICIKKVF